MIALLLAQLGLLTSQVRARGGGPTRLESMALRLVAPVARMVSGTIDLARCTGDGFKSSEALREEVAVSRRRSPELRMEKLRLQSLDDQVERLSNALGYKAPFEGQVRLADVVYVDHTSWLQTLFLFMPARQAVPGSAVASADGLVGRVILTEGSYAKVQLLTDRASGVGAMIERTRRQGIVRGAGRDGLALEYVPLQADVQVGDRVFVVGHRRPLPARRPDRDRGGGRAGRRALPLHPVGARCGLRHARPGLRPVGGQPPRPPQGEHECEPLGSPRPWSWHSSPTW